VNFWTFLDRNLVPIFFFIFLPTVILVAIGGPSIIKAFREQPQCTEGKP
jgi:hypothetical protein